MGFAVGSDGEEIPYSTSVPMILCMGPSLGGSRKPVGAPPAKRGGVRGGQRARPDYPAGSHRSRSCGAVMHDMNAYLLHNTTLIDGTGSDPVPDAAVLVADGRITWVGAESDFSTS